MADKYLFHYLNFLGALQTGVSHFLVADNELEVMSNVVISYKLGSILKRLGYSQVGGVLDANPITGLHNFRQSASVQKILATATDSTHANMTLQYNNGGTWTDITLTNAWDGFEDAKVEMEDFIGYCFFVGYDSIDGVWIPVGSLTGTTFSTSTNVTSMPQAKYIIRYRDRLYAINCYTSSTHYPYRTYFSSVPEAGAISWTVATDFIDVDWSEELTGGGENWDRLILFTEYSAYMYNQDQKKKVWDIGCSAHRTIKNSGPYMFWLNSDGVWVSTGGRPQNIGGKIIDFIRASSPKDSFADVVDEEYHLYLRGKNATLTAATNDTITSAAHGLLNGDEIYLTTNNALPAGLASETKYYVINSATDTFKISLTENGTAADVTGTGTGTHTWTKAIVVDGISYNNCTKIYNIPTKSWRTHQYKDMMTVFARYNDSGENRLYMGTNDGEIMNLSKYTDSSPVYTDDGSAISAHFQTKKFHFNSPEAIKSIDKIVAYATRALALELKCLVIDKDARSLNKLIPLKQLKEYITELTPKKSKGHFLQIVGLEHSSNAYFDFQGISVQVSSDSKLK